MIDDWKGWDFYNNNNDSRGPFYHGTHVAGIVSAETNNNLGIAGVAGGWNSQGARLLIAGVGDDYPDNSILDDAILYAAVKGAKIITMSLSVPQTAAIDAALSTAYNSYGCFIDCASGNDDASVAYPATNQYVVAVGATNDDDARCSPSDWGVENGSNYGPELSVVAPGDNIYSTIIGNSYGYASGTSMAAPHVAGIVALLKSVNANLTPAQIKTILEQSAEDKGAAGRDDYYGYGRANAYKAVKYTLENYGGTLTKSFTIPSDETWTFSDGITLKFNSGVSLTSNGRLNMYGEYGSPITLTTPSGTGSYGSWGSIYLSGGGANSSIIRYANINYGTEININSASYTQVQNCNISNTINGINAYAAHGYIGNNVLSNQRDHGIIINNSELLCYNNTISKSDHSGAALLHTAGATSYENYQNIISGYNWGITSSWGSSISSDLGYSPNNKIIDCLYGAYAYQYSSMDIGSTSCGYNSIHDNDTYNAIATTYSHIYASRNYWDYPVPTNKFYWDGTSSIDYSSALHLDPYEEEMVADNYPNLSALRTNLSASSCDPVAKARELRLAGKKQEAFDLLKSLFASGETRPEAIQELYALHGVPFSSEIEVILSSLPTDEAPLGQYLYGLIQSRKGDAQSSLEAFDKLSNTSFAKAASLAKFYVYLYNEKKSDLAEAILNGLSAVNVEEEMEIALARHSLRSNAGGNTPDSPEEEIASTTPSEFGLKPNYPNPFNPVTTIAFTLQLSGFTTLKIYDVLGREVATLVNENLEAGINHQHMFDASRLPSGVYYFALKSGNKQEVKKMLYLK